MMDVKSPTAAEEKKKEDDQKKSPEEIEQEEYMEGINNYLRFIRISNALKGGTWCYVGFPSPQKQPAANKN